MFRPQIQKTHVLVIMALFNILMVKWALYRENEELPNNNLMVEAAEIMVEAINALQDYNKINTDYIETDAFGNWLLSGIKNTPITTVLDSTIVLDEERCKTEWSKDGCIECYDYGIDDLHLL